MDKSTENTNDAEIVDRPSAELNGEISDADRDHSHDESCSVCSDESASVEHADEFLILEHKAQLRDANFHLPNTVATLDFHFPLEEVPENRRLCGKVYLIGTAHFSKESQEDVRRTIQATQPDVVMLELCSERLAILAMDEEKLLEEAKQMNVRKIVQNMKESGFVQGLLHCMLLSISANITKQLGMAPGGEFRTAFKEHHQVPGCKIKLGDRPINITLKRAFGSLSAWQKLKLFGGLLVSHTSKITKEDVEKTKNRDLLEELLREMAGEFPDMSRIFVDERDQFMAHILRSLALNTLSHRCHVMSTQNGTPDDFEKYPIVIVGVVGIGHMPGITKNWNEWSRFNDIAHLMTIPKPSIWPRYIRYGIRGTFLFLASYLVYRSGKFIYGCFA